MLGNKKIMGVNILRYLEERQIDRKEFARIIGVPYSTLTNWINGVTYPRIDKIQKMADFLGIEKADLVEDSKIRHTALTQQEVDLIAAFRESDEVTKGIVAKILGIGGLE